eukprot:jgi/Chrzof1/9249/UNPLg00216.t1
MNDLLSIVKGQDGVMARHGAESTSYDVETGYRDQQTGKGDEMNAFFERVSDIKADMNEIQAKQRQIQAMNERSKSIVRPKEMQQIRQDMQVTINEVSAVAHKVKSKVEALDKLNEAALQKKGQGIGTASERTRTSITAGLKKKLKDMMGEFSDLRARIHDEYRDVVERRVYTVTGQHLPEDDIDRMIDTGESENIFQKAILEQGRGRVLDVMAEIQERHRAVKDLEQSLLELHQIFLDMAVLVEAQGEMLDNIGQQVARSVEYVQSGTTQLQKAKELQKSRRKWCCCAIITLLMIVIIIVVVMLVQFLPRKS